MHYSVNSALQCKHYTTIWQVQCAAKVASQLMLTTKPRDILSAGMPGIVGRASLHLYIPLLAILKVDFFCTVKTLVLKFCRRKSAKISLKITQYVWNMKKKNCKNGWNA